MGLLRRFDGIIIQKISGWYDAHMDVGKERKKIILAALESGSLVRLYRMRA